MRLYNTLTRQVEDVRPLEEGRVRMYTCGPTVYRPVHIGNLRTFLLADLIRRALEFEGLDVLQVVNITDVGHMVDDSTEGALDRMELAMDDEGLGPWEIAEKYTRVFLEDAAKIGILRAHEYPRATDHIREMLDMTAILVDRRHAYALEDGTVYYDVRSFPEYGRLSRNTLENLQPAHRDLEADDRKRHHADFALWKRAQENRLMKWDSPWGEGFPGWHIECSAMSVKYLGDRFDVHTGGADLIFPHHEDEIAQSDAALGHRVVSTWVHGGHLRVEGHKMAKSAGNVYSIDDLIDRGHDPLAFRLLCFQTRYRSEMNFTWDAMAAADRTLARWRQRMADWEDAPGDGLSPAGKDLDRRFREAVADDLDLPRAVGIVNETVSSALPEADRSHLLRSWDAVLGLDLGRVAGQGVEVPGEVRSLVEERDAARSAKDYARSDDIRDRLAIMGWEVMDTPEGTMVRPRTERGGRWTRPSRPSA